MNLPDIPQELLELQYQALVNLHAMYIFSRQDDICPLCEAAQQYAIRSVHFKETCDYCPWIWFRKESCLHYGSYPGIISLLKMAANDEPEKIRRMEEIEDWLTSIRAEVKKRER